MDLAEKSALLVRVVQLALEAVSLPFFYHFYTSLMIGQTASTIVPKQAHSI